MEASMRNTGIGPVGYRPWGTHFCNFYESKIDLVEMLVPYLKAGLENRGFCVWTLSEPVTEPEAWNALSFDTFFSTKPHGMSMILPISLSIVERPNDDQAVTLQFTLPASAWTW
jgi:hypothetical protein